VETREITQGAKHTTQGWTMTRQLDFDNTSSRECSTKVSFQLTCRR